jgi:hypothetical protein
VTVQTQHLRLALVALGAAVLYNMWVFLGPSARTSPGPVGQQPLLASNDLPAVAAAPTADPASVPAPPPVDELSPLALRRDPFLFADERRDGPVPAARPARLADPVVTTILFSPTRQTAIVDGVLAGVGQVVGAFTVVAIERDAVVVSAPDGEPRRVALARPGAAGVRR